MSERARLVASLPHGPRDPVGGTPPRRPGSVRRTTSIEQGWVDLGDPTDAGPVVVRAAGRDLLTRADGTTEVLDQLRLTLELDATGTITAAATEPPVPGCDGLVGTPVWSGFRARAAEVVGVHRAPASVLHQLLDDVPLAALIGSYGMTREHPEWNIPPEHAERLADVCAGWGRDGTMLGALGSTGIFPIPVGPPAPELVPADDPLAWHDLAPMAPRSVRRVRRLDLVAGEPLELDVHFRDAHADAQGAVDVLHEYVLRADVDPATLTLLAVAVEARTLPWPECPGAMASAQRVVGQRAPALPALVAAELTGTSTCTHLNDLLRSLAGAAPMAEALR